MFENNSNYNIHSIASSRSYLYVYNTKNEYFSDPNVRRAVSMTIDKEGFVNTLMNGFGSVADLCFPESYEFGDSKLTGPEYNPEEAEKLLDELGWKKGSDGIRAKDGQKLSFTLQVGNRYRWRRLC